MVGPTDLAAGTTRSSKLLVSRVEFLVVGLNVLCQLYR